MQYTTKTLLEARLLTCLVHDSLGGSSSVAFPLGSGTVRDELGPAERMSVISLGWGATWKTMSPCSIGLEPREKKVHAPPAS